MELLPTEMKIKIISCCNIISIIMLQRTSKNFYIIIKTIYKHFNNGLNVLPGYIYNRISRTMSINDHYNISGLCYEFEEVIDEIEQIRKNIKDEKNKLIKYIVEID